MKRSEVVEIICSQLPTHTDEKPLDWYMFWANAILTKLEEIGMRPQNGGTCCGSGCSPEWDPENE